MLPEGDRILTLSYENLTVEIDSIVSGTAGYDRTLLQGMNVEYSVPGAAILRSRSFRSKHRWQISTYLSDRNAAVLEQIFQRSDLASRTPPFSGYEILFNDTGIPYQEPSPRTRVRVGDYEETAEGWVRYFAQFSTIAPLDSFTMVQSGSSFKPWLTSFVLMEA